MTGIVSILPEAKVALEGHICEHKFVVKMSISDIGDPKLFEASVSVLSAP